MVGTHPGLVAGCFPDSGVSVFAVHHGSPGMTGCTGRYPHRPHFVGGGYMPCPGVADHGCVTPPGEPARIPDQTVTDMDRLRGEYLDGLNRPTLATLLADIKAATTAHKVSASVPVRMTGTNL